MVRAGRFAQVQRIARPSTTQPLAARQNPFLHRLRIEPLEDRRMLSVYMVNSLSDITPTADGLITLREALQAANTNATVFDAPAGQSHRDRHHHVRAGTLHRRRESPARHDYPQQCATRNHRRGGCRHSEGRGAKLLAIDAAGQSRVFYVSNGAVASLSGMTITGGVADNGGGRVQRRRHAEDYGFCLRGQFRLANGVAASRTAACVQCSIRPSAKIRPSRAAGFIARTPPLSIANSTFYGNSAISSGGGIWSGNHCLLSLINSTVVGNTAGTNGGGLRTIYPQYHRVTNSIIAMNHANVDPDVSSISWSSNDRYNLIGIWDLLTTPGENGVWGTSLAPLDPLLMTVVDAEGGFVGFRPHPGQPRRRRRRKHTGGRSLGQSIDGRCSRKDKDRGRGRLTWARWNCRPNLSWPCCR